MNTSPKIILITGCSSGFGMLTAVHLSTKGHKVIATLRDLSKNTDLKNRAKEFNTTIDIQQLDVNKPETITTTIEYIKQKYGRIDILINNAGYSIGGFFEDLSDQDIRSIMETNFFGVQNLTRSVLPIMREQKQGKIINISSVSGLTTYPGLSGYNASKWALEAFSECLYYEVKQFGINVCLIEPGSYRTKIFEENGRYAENFNNPQSPYYQISQSLKELVMQSIKNNKRDPMAIAYLIEKLINQKNPPLRNILGINVKTIYVLRKILPFKIFSFIIESIFKNRFKNTD
ncbi:MAG: SDR family oxidoreductase [Candidatus Omnitrophica bacterium]|nr:SDR family oxidoreductase [Candidatus Omnitrophota bacterium]